VRLANVREAIEGDTEMTIVKMALNGFVNINLRRCSCAHNTPDSFVIEVASSFLLWHFKNNLPLPEKTILRVWLVFGIVFFTQATQRRTQNIFQFPLM
jgi:hypothetical protein